jgi:hypothetical protein
VELVPKPDRPVSEGDVIALWTNPLFQNVRAGICFDILRARSKSLRHGDERVVNEMLIAEGMAKALACFDAFINAKVMDGPNTEED